jgi:hypothetical protein
MAIAAATGLGGCCGVPPPPAEKFFDRTSPEATLKGFVYAVDAHQWGYAYESLSKSTRDEIGAVKFQVAIRYLREPETDVPLFDLISNALELRRPEGSTSEVERVLVVISKGHDSGGTLVFVKVRIYFGLEDGEWRLDLMRSLGREPGAGPPPDLSFRDPPAA